MKKSSGRRQVALLGLAVGVAGWLGAIQSAPTEEPARLPASLRGEPKIYTVAKSPLGGVSISEAVTVETPMDGPMLNVVVQDPPPPVSQPQLLPRTAGPRSELTPVPVPLPPPINVAPSVIAQGQENADPNPTVYRERPTGNKRSKAAIISENRGNEPEWYREWRIKHYGYYPTQWRPWPEGWHAARNLTPPPHPYDLRQPQPENPDDRKLNDRPRSKRNSDGPDRAPPLKTLPKEGKKNST